jgi:glycosyltransferase involved in cell wall biosynthesis
MDKEARKLDELMRIAIVGDIDFPDGGAVAQRVLMMSKGLASLGHEMHIIVPYKYDGGPLEAPIEGINTHWAADGRHVSRQKLLRLAYKRYALCKAIKQLLCKGFDWLVLYDMELDALPLFILAKRAGCRVAAENCDIRTVIKQAFVRNLFHLISYQLGHLLVTPHLDLNFAISQYIKTYLQRVAPRVPCVEAPALVDTGQFWVDRLDIESFRKKYDLENITVIGYFGGTWVAKGFEFLLQVIKRLALEGNRFKLLITNRPRIQTAGVMKLIEELESQTILVMTGHLPREELLLAMASADILVEPKIEHKANQAAFPQKLVEYLSMGKPIVAAATGDIPLYLRDGDNALLCRPGDSESLAQALTRLLQDEPLRRHLARRARQTAIEHFDNRLIAQRLEKALQAFDSASRP